MQVVLAPASEPVTDTLIGQMGASRAGLLQAGTPFLELAALVVEVVGTADEPPCRSHGDMVVDVAVHAEDSRILGFLRIVRVYLSFHRRVQVELVGFAVVVDGTG